MLKSGCFFLNLNILRIQILVFLLTLVMLTFKRTKWFVIALWGFVSHGAIDVKTDRKTGRKMAGGQADVKTGR